MTGVKVRIKRGLYKDCTGLVTNVFKSLQVESSGAGEPADALGVEAGKCPAITVALVENRRPA